MKKIVKKILDFYGYDLRKSQQDLGIGSPTRPVGHMDLFLEDLVKRGLICRTVIDVGANKTEWSRIAKKIFPAANFCLIEPQTEMIEYLEQFCRDFDGSVYFLAGAGSKKDRKTLTIWDDLAGSSFIPQPDENLKHIGKQREIEQITIDDLIESSQIDLPQLVKLDIQGYELEALKGASKTFGYTDVYIMEVSLFPFLKDMPTFFDVVDFMMERGYVVYDFPGFLRRPVDGSLGQCDICFVKEKGFLRRDISW